LTANDNQQQLAVQVVFFLLLRFHPSPSRRRPKTPARPLVAPSEEHFHGGGLGPPLFRERRRTKDAQQSRKKKTMKTNQKNQIGLGSKSAQLSSTNTPETQSAVAPAQPEKKDNRLPIDTEARKKNRTLPTPKVLELLKTSNPGLFNLAEVVGKWVWVQFRETPAPELRQILAQLGFHWNRERQAWQHPCGAFRLRGFQDPHEKYASYFPADTRAA
jgi:hypothetical protein